MPPTSLAGVEPDVTAGVSQLVVIARFVAIALAVGISVAGLVGNWIGFRFDDVNAYWDAALRLRAGEPLYAAGPGDTISHYRYAPWFAYFWVPLTFLPRSLVELLWGIPVTAAGAILLWHLGRRGWAGMALAGLLGVQLIWSIRGGNPQSLIVAGLYFGLYTRWGPFVIAAAATLKVLPLAFALVYVARREWGRLVATLSLTALLASSLLAHDLSGYGSRAGNVGTNFALLELSPVLWALLAVAAAVIVGWLAWRGSPATALAAATAALAVTPRLVLYDTTLLLGAANPPRLSGREPEVPAPSISVPGSRNVTS